MGNRIDLAIELDEDDPSWDGASTILQAGFLVEAVIGVSAREFMRAGLGFPDEYIERSVSTVFLDFSPVDDIDAAIVLDGSELALSAAMPGLVGAMMRRGSPYAPLRESISYVTPRGGEERRCVARSGLVRVRLFNSIMRERGREILRRGILVDARAAPRFLAGPWPTAAPRPVACRRVAAEGLVALRVAERRKSE